MTQRQVVIDLTIECNHEPPGSRHHRLVPRRREIENGQPAVSERESNIGIGPHPPIIRATMQYLPSHGLGSGVGHLGLKTPGLNEPSQTAHAVFSTERSSFSSRG